KKSFRPNEYEILSYINQRLEKFNKLLVGSDISLLYSIPKINPRTKIIAEKTKSLMDNHNRLYDELFSTTGFKTYLAYQRHLSKIEGIDEILKQVRYEKTEFAMYRPHSGRWWIEKTGFKNQHVTNSSRGYHGKRGRNTVEASHMNNSYENYAKLDDDIKPKYGMLLPDFDSGIRFDHVDYGEDIYIFKKTVRDRVTFTLGDSLNSLERRSGVSWRHGDVFKVDAWDKGFIPGRKSELMVPYLKEQYTKNRYWTLRNSSIEEAKLTQYWEKNTEYLELQYWGELKVDDVKDFIFLSEPPTKEFYQFLRSKKINVYDGRKLSSEGKRVLWQP